MYRRHHHALLPNQKFLRSTSLLITGVLIGSTIVTTTASTKQVGHQPVAASHVIAEPPAELSNSSCQAETLAYAAAYAAYEASVETLNDAYDALYACQYGNGGGEPEEPEEERFAKLANLPSVLESR